MKQSFKLLKKIMNRKNMIGINFLIICIICSGIIEPVIIWGYKLIIDYAGHIMGKSLFSIFLLLFFYEIFQVILHITTVIKEHFQLRVNYSFDKRILAAIHEKIKKIEIEELDNSETYDLIDRIGSLSDEFLELLTDLVQIVTILFSFLIYFIMLMNLKSYFPFLMILAEFPVLYLEWKKNKERFCLTKELYPKERLKHYFLNVIFERENVKDIKLLKAEDFFYKKANDLNDFSIKENIHVLKKYFIMEIVVNIIKYGVFGICLFETCTMVSKQPSELGSIMLLINAFEQFTLNLNVLMGLFNEIFNMKWFMDEWNIFENLKEKQWGNKRPIKYDIEFENVRFIYPNTTKYALENISVKINEGERVAIVGENGSGKSTFINLLTGMYHTTSGSIKVGNVDIKEIDRKYSRKIICVFQNFIKYNMSVKENIAMDGEINFQNPIIKILNMDTFFNNLVDGENTLLGQINYEGTEISGGQWQKLAICRGMNKDSSILIMDEPTSSLDPKMENELYENIVDICKNKTLLLISHRMSACRVCDRILTFSNGKIIENGSFDELMDLKGEFYKMYTAQKECY